MQPHKDNAARLDQIRFDQPTWICFGCPFVCFALFLPHNRSVGWRQDVRVNKTMLTFQEQSSLAWSLLVGHKGQAILDPSAATMIVRNLCSTWPLDEHSSRPSPNWFSSLPFNVRSVSLRLCITQMAIIIVVVVPKPIRMNTLANNKSQSANMLIN